MDMASIGTAFSAVDLIRRGLAAAIEVKDFTRAAAEMAKLNEALISAQTALLTQNSTLFDLQREKFETAERLRKLEEALSERGRYTLFELTKGGFVYRMNVAQVPSGTGVPDSSEPMHYLCQPCFDNGRKCVLQRTSSMGSIYATCPVCENNVDTGETYDMPTLMY